LQLASTKILRGSFNQAYSFALAMPASDVRDDMLYSLANSVDVGDFVVMALKILANMSNESRRNETILNRALLCYDDDKKGVEMVLPDILSGHMLDSFYKGLSERYAYTNYARSIEMLNKICDKNVLFASLEAVIKILAYKDRSQASELVSRITYKDLQQKLRNSLEQIPNYPS